MLREAALLEHDGRIVEAIAVYERLLARWPDRPDSWYNLALLQRRAGRYQAALASYQQALDRGVRRPEEVHLNRGVIYADFLRRDAAAAAELKAALAINPRYVPALLNLANLHEDLGQRQEAGSLYERTLAIDPRCHVALARLAGLREPSGVDDPLIARLRAVLARADVAPADRASLGFALGRMLDACGAYEQAFEAYRAANEQSRASVATYVPRYDGTRQERYADALITAFAQRRDDARTPQAQLRPIFICGMFRSGSTLTEQVLAAHRRVHAGGEIDVLPALVQRELAPYPASLANMPRESLESLAQRYLRALEARHPGAELVTDKRPDNFLHIGLIKTLFPDARIVHTTRNPLDNCLSIYFLHLDQRMSYALDLMDIGHYYRQYRRLMAHWQTLFGPDILNFDYDAFVREPRPAVERLLEFCGLESEDACLDFSTATGAVKTASVWQVRQPLYRSSSGRARHYEQQLAPLRSLLRDLLPDE